MDCAELLMQFGLTRQEAVIYMELMSNELMTGYEIAKHTGISRSNTYSALTSLVEKGAAYIAEGTPAKYMAVDISEFCENKIAYLNGLKEELENRIPKNRDDVDGYITISGQRHIIDKIRQMLTKAEYRVYFSASPDIIQMFKEQLEALIQDEKKVVLLTDAPYALDKAIIYHNKRQPGQIGLIVDSEVVLTGEIGGSNSCLYSKKKNLVHLFKTSLKNEIKLIAVTERRLQS